MKKAKKKVEFSPFRLASALRNHRASGIPRWGLKGGEDAEHGAELRGAAEGVFLLRGEVRVAEREVFLEAVAVAGGGALGVQGAAYFLGQYGEVGSAFGAGGGGAAAQHAEDKRIADGTATDENACRGDAQDIRSLLRGGDVSVAQGGAGEGTRCESRGGDVGCPP